LRYIFVVLVLLWVLIYPATDLYVRFGRYRTWRRKSASRAIFLTFDDGPDPQYLTPLLEILRRYQVPAFFFLIAARAEAAPGLALRIQAAGHGIGSHSLGHRHAYWMLLRKSLGSVFEAQRRLERIIDTPVGWFRPPWGAVNLFQLWAVNRAGQQVALWDVNAADWKARTTIEQIVQRILDKVKTGSIIVLHDAGGDPGTPEKTLQALPLAIERLRAAGYQFQRLDKAGEGQVCL
jgi:peptidoglycan/xylan/chitin deacetylase (PgdA/CDA1 family)